MKFFLEIVKWVLIVYVILQLISFYEIGVFNFSLSQLGYSIFGAILVLVIEKIIVPIFRRFLF